MLDMSHLVDEGRIFAACKTEDKIDLHLEEYESLGHYLLAKLKDEFADDVLFIEFETGRSWTGAQMHHQVLTIAHTLADRFDVGFGSSVCISFDNTVSSVMVAIACICAGAFVACSYPKDPFAELANLARKVGVKVLFCHEKNREKWAKRLSEEMGYQVQAISMDGSGEQSLEALLSYERARSKVDQIPRISPDINTQLALITMSSGTTGQPKAVALTHRNCLAELVASVKHRGKAHGRGITNACSSSLDYVSGRILMFGAINAGFKSIVINGFEPESFVRCIDKYRVNLIFLGSASFYSFISWPQLSMFDLSSLIMVYLAGAKMTYLKELSSFLKKYPNIALIGTGYGSSETSGVSSRRVPPSQYLSDPDNCGKLVFEVAAKVVEVGSGRLLGQNETGILHVKSDSMFAGYYDCQLIAKQGRPFLRDSSIFDKDGFYITGDLAYFNDNDELFIIGRQKELMSCRGAKKVLPQELEVLLLEHPAVGEVCVLGIASEKSPSLQHCPRAFVKPKVEIIKEPERIESIKESRMRVSTLNEELDKEMRELTLNNQLRHEGNPASKLCSLAPHWRRKLAEDLMDFMNERIGWEKQLTGGIVILDNIPTSRETGKMNKRYLRSLQLDTIEIYGDQSSA